MAITTTSDLNSLFNNVYEGSQFVYQQRRLMANLVEVRRANTFAPRVLSKYGQQTASAVSEGNSVSATSLTKTAVGTITPSRIHHMIQLTNEDIMTDPDGAERSAARVIGDAIARKEDTDLVGNFGSFTKSKGTAGSALTIGHVAAAMSVLTDQNAMGTRYAVVHPYQWHDLAVAIGQLDQAPAQAFLGDVANEAMREYYVNNFLSAQWFTNANIAGVGTVTGAVFTEEALIYDERTSFMMNVDEDFDTESYKLHGIVRYAHGINRDESGVKLVSDGTEPA